MDVLVGLLYIILGLAALAILVIGAFYVFALLPAIVGLTLGIILWTSGHDNVGAIFALLGIGGQVVWTFWIDSGKFRNRDRKD